MRNFPVEKLTEVVAEAVQRINTQTPTPVMVQLDAIYRHESSPTGRAAMRDILDNRQIAAERRLPMCQDTGMVVLFLEVGQDVHFTGGDVQAALNEGVRLGYEAGYLRKSIVGEPLFERRNTGDNTPAVIHFELVAGEGVALTIAAKGFGAENMSRALVLTPAQGIDGVEREVVGCVEDAGPNACPPVVVGVGIGGTLEMSALLAKRALMREVGVPNPDARYAALEARLLAAVNRTGIGPQGYGGRYTASEVRVEWFPTHIAGIPLTINLDCHLQRHIRLVL